MAGCTPRARKAMVALFCGLFSALCFATQSFALTHETASLDEWAALSGTGSGSGGVNLLATIRNSGTHGWLSVAVAGYSAGKYTVSAVTVSTGTTLDLGTLAVHGRNHTAGFAVFGPKRAPFPAGLSPFDIATISLSDSNGNVLSTGTLTPVQNGFYNALSPLVSSTTTASGYAMIRAFGAEPILTVTGLSDRPITEPVSPTITGSAPSDQGGDNEGDGSSQSWITSNNNNGLSQTGIIDGGDGASLLVTPNNNDDDGATLTISGGNTYTGATTIGGGLLNAGSGTTLIGGGTLTVFGPDNYGGGIVVGTGANLTLINNPGDGLTIGGTPVTTGTVSLGGTNLLTLIPVSSSTSGIIYSYPPEDYVGGAGFTLASPSQGSDYSLSLGDATGSEQQLSLTLSSSPTPAASPTPASETSALARPATHKATAGETKAELPPVTGVVTGEITIHAHGLPPNSPVFLATDTGTIATVDTDLRGNLSVTAFQGGTGTLPSTLDLYAIQFIAIEDTSGNVILTAGF